MFDNNYMKIHAVCEYIFSSLKNIYLCCEVDSFLIKKNESVDNLSILLYFMKISA